MTFALDEAVAFALPLSRRFRGTTLREGVLVRIGDRWGEWAPFPEYDDVTAARWLSAALEQAGGDWPDAVRTSVPVNAIVPALDPSEVGALVLDAVQADGCTTIKVKVGEPGQSFADDVARVAEVRAVLDACGAAEALIRVDVNGAWTVEEAAVRLDVLADVALGLEYASSRAPPWPIRGTAYAHRRADRCRRGRAARGQPMTPRSTRSVTRPTS